MREVVSKEEQIFRFVAKLWIMKERLGLSWSSSSASEPIGGSGEVMPVLKDLPDIKASLATWMAVWAHKRVGCCSLGDAGSPTLDLALQNNSLAAAVRKLTSFGSASMSSVSSVSSLSLARSSASFSGVKSSWGHPVSWLSSVQDSMASGSAIKKKEICNAIIKESRK